MKTNKEISRILKKIEGSKKDGVLVDQSNFENELAAVLRSKGRMEEAMEQYEIALATSIDAGVLIDTALNLRALAELHAEEGNAKECRLFLSRYEEAAKGDPVQCQLHLHVSAWCEQQLFLHDDDESHLVQAIDYCKASLRYMEQNRAALERAIRQGKDLETIPHRQADLYRMMCEMLPRLDRQQESKEYLEKARKLSAGDYVREYELVRTCLNWDWIDKVDVARQMVEMARNKAGQCGKSAANFELLQAHFHHGDAHHLKEGIRVLYEVITSSDKLNEDDRERMIGLQVYAWRMEKRMKKLHECERTNNVIGQHYQNDRMGDLSSDAGFKQAALAFYEKTIDLSDSREKRRAALTSCAETARELRKWDVSLKYFDLLRKHESAMGLETAETECSIFVLKLDGRKFKSDDAVEAEIDRLKILKGNRFMDIVYARAAKYFSSQGKSLKANHYAQLDKDYIKPSSSQGSDEHDTNADREDDIDQEPDEAIVREMTGRAKAHQRRLNLVSKRDKKDPYGETRLHIACREGDVDEVKDCLALGFDVNAVDNVGWTPLSEAVSANHIDVVRILIMKNANVNTASKSGNGFVNSDFGGKVTPLMESAWYGRVDMCRLLMSCKASVIVTNEDKWTPADFAKDYINMAEAGEHGEVDPDHLKAMKKLLRDMEAIQRKNGYPVRAGDPPSVSKKSDSTPRYEEEMRRAKANAKRQQNKKKSGVDEFREGLMSVGSRSTNLDKSGRRRMTDDMDSDDEPLLPSSSSGRSKRAVVVSSSDENDEPPSGRSSSRMKSVDSDSDRELITVKPTYSSSQKPQSSTGVGRLMKRKRKNIEEIDNHHTGIEIVPDNFVDENEDISGSPLRPTTSSGAGKKKKKREAREESLERTRASIDREGDYGSSERGLASERRERSIQRDTRELTAESELSTPKLPRAQSSMSIPSQVTAKMKLRVKVTQSGKDLISAGLVLPSETMLEEILRSSDAIRQAIDGQDFVWKMNGDVYEKMTLKDVSEFWESDGMMTLMCEVKEKQQKESMVDQFERLCAPHDRGGAISTAIAKFERNIELSLSGGAQYIGQTETALWRVLSARVDDASAAPIRVDPVAVEDWELSSVALRALGRIAASSDTLSLRRCSIAEDGLDVLCEVLGADCKIKILDVGDNDFITSASLINLISKMPLLRSFVLQRSKLIDGVELMSYLSGRPLISQLSLDDSPWLNDDALAALGTASHIVNLRLARAPISRLPAVNGGWGARLRTLSLAGCTLSDQVWNDLCDWMTVESSVLAHLDLTQTNALIEVIEAVLSRSRSAPLLTLVLINVPSITVADLMRILSREEVDLSRIKLQLDKEKATRMRVEAAATAMRILKNC